MAEHKHVRARGPSETRAPPAQCTVGRCVYSMECRVTCPVRGVSSEWRMHDNSVCFNGSRWRCPAPASHAHAPPAPHEARWHDSRSRRPRSSHFTQWHKDKPRDTHITHTTDENHSSQHTRRAADTTCVTGSHSTRGSYASLVSVTHGVTLWSRSAISRLPSASPPALRVISR